MPPKNRKLSEEERGQIQHAVLQMVNDVPSSVLKILAQKPLRRDREWADMFLAQHPTWSHDYIDYAVDVVEGHRSVTLDRVMQELIEARDVLAELGSFSGQLLHELESRLRPLRSDSSRMVELSASSGRDN